MKVHKINVYFRALAEEHWAISACGIEAFNTAARFNRIWRGVTCKNCLRRKPRRRA